MSIQRARELLSQVPTFYILALNDMRSSNIENTEAVALFDTAEMAQAFLDANKVEGYRDGKWGKAYRAGSMLEWYNEPFSSLDQGIFKATEAALHMGLPENPIDTEALTASTQPVALESTESAPPPAE